MNEADDNDDDDDDEEEYRVDDELSQVSFYGSNGSVSSSPYYPSCFLDLLKANLLKANYLFVSCDC